VSLCHSFAAFSRAYQWKVEASGVIEVIDHEPTASAQPPWKLGWAGVSFNLNGAVVFDAEPCATTRVAKDRNMFGKFPSWKRTPTPFRSVLSWKLPGSVYIPPDGISLAQYGSGVPTNGLADSLQRTVPAEAKVRSVTIDGWDNTNGQTRTASEPTARSGDRWQMATLATNRGS